MKGTVTLQQGKKKKQEHNILEMYKPSFTYPCFMFSAKLLLYVPGVSESFLGILDDFCSPSAEATTVFLR